MAITDITDKKLAETALMRAEAYAQAVVESAVEAVISIDSQGVIETSNLAAQSMFGYSPKAIKLMPATYGTIVQYQICELRDRLVLMIECFEVPSRSQYY